MNQSSRTIKTRPPVAAIIAIVLGCVLLLAGIFYATMYWNRTFVDARMTGVIVDKQFVPEPREEVTIGGQGLRAVNTPGTFTFTVRVRHRDGDSQDFTVWVPEVMFNNFAVGDNFDVGPYLVPGSER